MSLIARLFRRPDPAGADPRAEFLKVVEAHARTIEVCGACALTTRDLAAEVARGGTPNPADLRATIAEAERVLEELDAVRNELERLRAELGGQR
jgi:hypothetical protein